MLTNKKLIYRIILTIGIFSFLLLTVIVYINKYSKDGIFKNVLKQDNYKVYEIQKPLHFTAYIEPTWIPSKEKEVIELNEVIGEVGNVKIIIKSIMHRGNDIFFNFGAIQYINYNGGEFLYNYILNEDGGTSATSYFLADSYNINVKGNKLDIGQLGYGPDSQFSFGINIEDYELIMDGFTLEYRGSILYGYSLVD
ncbi:MAG: hypothetical protein ACYDEX_01080 [Mobilitalea sp.]